MGLIKIELLLGVWNNLPYSISALKKLASGMDRRDILRLAPGISFIWEFHNKNYSVKILLRVFLTYLLDYCSDTTKLD